MKKQLREIIESLIFVSLEPLTLEKLKTILAEYPEQEIKHAIDKPLEATFLLPNQIMISG